LRRRKTTAAPVAAPINPEMTPLSVNLWSDINLETVNVKKKITPRMMLLDNGDFVFIFFEQYYAFKEKDVE
jgi:hypothetical protein